MGKRNPSSHTMQCICYIDTTQFSHKRTTWESFGGTWYLHIFTLVRLSCSKVMLSWAHPGHVFFPLERKERFWSNLISLPHTFIAAVNVWAGLVVYFSKFRKTFQYVCWRFWDIVLMLDAFLQKHSYGAWFYCMPPRMFITYVGQTFTKWNALINNISSD